MTRKYRAIIVDDEILLINALKSLLNEFCPEIEIIATANSAFEANLKIQVTHPDIVFLDINLPKVNGLELLKTMENKKFQVIIITAYDHFALEALKAGAIDYILKPVASSEVRDAVDKAIKIIHKQEAEAPTVKKEPEIMPEPENEVLSKIVIHHNNSYMLIEFGDILWLEADRNYTNIVLDNGKIISSAKSLKSYETLLPKDLFFRVHKSYLINTQHIKEYLKDGKERVVLMKNGQKITVSQPKQPEFKKFLTTIYKK
ncbi:MAG: LytTR family DNA-binding domain-containing protein [Bacteroidota bacterium]